MSVAAEEALHYIDENTSGLSPQRFNAKSRTAGTAEYILAASPKFPGQQFRCILEGSEALQIDRTYSVSSDGDSLLPETGIKHYHNDDTDEAGGLFRDILFYNWGDFILINPIMKTDNFFTEVSNGAVFNNVQDGIQLVTNSGSGAYGNASIPGPNLSFGAWSMSTIRGGFVSGTRMTLKWGLRMEQVNVDPGGLRRAGLEACDTVGTPRNFNVVSADGNTWTSTPTLEPVAQSGSRGYRIFLEPGFYVTFHAKSWDNESELITLKTNNIPPRGSALLSSFNDSWRLGYRTNEAVSKTFNWYNMRTIFPTHPFYW